jgi:hypothetical protein
MRRLKRRAERYAAALIAAQNTVRNWTHEQAGVNLTGAYMAGYRSASRARKAVNLRVLDHQLLKDKVAELETQVAQMAVMYIPKL